MKRINVMMLMVAVMTCAACLMGCKTLNGHSAPDDRSIVVLFENDVHCGVEGYAKMAGLRDAVRDTAYVAVVSSGDYLQGGTIGAISHGRYIADIMHHVGYDALSLGNHEFDYYVPVLDTLIRRIGAPATCVNFRTMEGKRVYSEYVMKRYGKRKVAFVGAVTPTTLYTEAYSFFDKDDNQLYDLAEKEVYALVQQAVDHARKDGADYVVVLAHLGEDENTLNVDSHGLIRSTRGIDVVLDAHTHSVVPHTLVPDIDGHDVVIAQTGTKFENIGKLIIKSDGTILTELVPSANVTLVNRDVQQATDSVISLVDELIRRPVCDSEVDLRILDEKGYQLVRVSETNAGDIVADAYRTITGADFAITNGGGIRAETKAGRLTYGDILSMLPYDNYVSIVDITGAELKALLKACTQFVPVKNGDFPQVSGIKFTVNVGMPESITDLVVLNRQTGNYEPIDLSRTYSLATIDYCITGGGLQGMLKKNHVVRPNICIYSDCLIQYVTKHLGGHIGKEYANQTGQGRITIKY